MLVSLSILKQFRSLCSISIRYILQEQEIMLEQESAEHKHAWWSFSLNNEDQTDITQ